MAISERTRRSLTYSVLILLGVALLLALAWPKGSLWYDEALTTYVATDSWQTLWQWVTQVDIQVPFHYVMLRLWAAFAGNSEFALRALSALCLPLAVAGIIATGRRLLRANRPALGLAAGVLLGALPGVFWIAYEVRAYATALALYAWATAFLIALLDGRPLPLRRRWMVISYALLMAATLYTHYTALGAFAGHVLIAGVSGLGAFIREVRRKTPLRHSLRALVMSLLPVILAGAAFLPWLPVVMARGAADRSYFPGDHILPGRSLEVMAAFKALGRQDQPQLPQVARVLGAGYGVLIVSGFLGGLLSRRLRRPVLLALVLTGLPLALVLALLYVNPKLTGRYFWPAWVGLDILAAVALVLITRWRTALTLLLSLILVAIPWFTGQRGKSPDSDYRGAFALLCSVGSPDDVILLRDGTLFVTARYYGVRPPCDSPRATFGMPDSLITDVTRYLDLGTLQGVMKQVAQRKPPSVWVMAWQGDIMDPQALTYALLDAAGQRTLAARMFGDVRLDRYEALDYALLSEMSVRGPLPFANWLNLTPAPNGPTLVATRWFPPKDGQHAKAGDKIVIQAWWTRGSNADPFLRVSPRLTTLDQGWTYTQDDQPPAGWYFYDDRWTPGIPTLGRYELTIGPDVPAGTFAVRYQIYDAQNRWAPITVTLGTLEIGK